MPAASSCAIRRRRLERTHSDAAARPGSVFDDDCGGVHAAQALGQATGKDVCAAPRRKAHQNACVGADHLRARGLGHQGKRSECAGH